MGDEGGQGRGWEVGMEEMGKEVARKRMKEWETIEDPILPRPLCSGQR